MVHRPLLRCPQRQHLTHLPLHSSFASYFAPSLIKGIPVYLSLTSLSIRKPYGFDLVHLHIERDS